MQKYITLKEAAKISGYSADYLGQLIRKGKLPGKRVFLNEAWVTTEDDVRTYMVSETTGRRVGFLEAFFETKTYQKLVSSLLYIALGIGVAMILFSFYVLSSLVDHSLQENAIHAVQGSTASQGRP